MIDEDRGAFLADFGIVAEWNAETAKVLFDQPETQVLGGRMNSVGYAITYASTSFQGLSHGHTVTIEEKAYQVVEVARLDDGAFSRAILQL